MSIKCKSGKTVKKTKSYMGYFKNNNAIMEVSDSCPNADKNFSMCKECYGKIILIKYDYFDDKEKGFITKVEVDRDYFKNVDYNIVEYFKASSLERQFIITSEIVKHDNKTPISTFMWNAYDRPTTHKTDCSKCKIKHNDYPPCKQTEENKALGLPKYFCGIQKQKRMKF